MKEKENKNIENFFKKRLVLKEFSYQEADWQNLNQRLDAAGMVSGEGSFSISPVKLIIAGVVIGFLAFFAGWFMHDSLPDSGREVVKNESAVSPSSLENPDQNTLSGENPQNTSKGHSSTQSNLPDRVTSQSLAKKKRENMVEGFPVAQAVPSAHDQATQALAQSRETIKVPLFINHSISSKGMVGFQAPHYKKPKISSDILFLLNNQNTATVPQPVSTIERKNSRFSVGMSVAPDFNSVGMGKDMILSLRPGVNLYYEIFNHLSISTGLYYNRKKYETEVGGYHPPTGYWNARTNGKLPANIDGSCAVIDIPVNLIYQWTNNPKINFAASVGISNYILLDEYYDFEFSEENPEADKGWYTDKNSGVISGVGNLSVQASVQLGRHTKLLFEPYLKAPLKNIGWGRVALYSSGFQIILKQSFPVRRYNRKM
ncbi:hypothetical protein [Reichenbachiella sp. MALMAid0571]|uniref:hypothetical protein n=1 Tax=Reichenbachiella sp. MALMAid0571 TaxID=3143939 RepID=UPI0032DF2FA7